MLNPGIVLCAKYEIIKTIGRGGMSTVYLAKDRISEKLYAIKDVERSGQDRNSVVDQSLAVEANMLKRLSNPHLPRIYEVIEDVNSFMLVMDYVEGESLDKVIARTGPQKTENIYDWSKQICEVFDYLHGQPQPVVYRDMKPANVILQPNGNIMLIDFGTARTQKIGLFMQSDTICIGTEGFAAPEQFGGISQSDARTDIFCLGATIYNLLTGHSPCDTPKGILPLNYFDESLVGTPLDHIIKKCTRNDPNERYQSARELCADLELAESGKFQKAHKGNGQSGGLKHSGWQMQKLKTGNESATGLLSGLLRNPNTPSDKSEAAKQQVNSERLKNRQVPQSEKSPQESQTVNSAPQRQSEVPKTENSELQEQEGGSIWRTVTWILIVVSVLFFVLGIICLVIRQAILCVVIISLAVVVAALAVFSMIKANKAENPTE